MVTTDRKRLAVLFGGRSGEHEVSVRSAQSVIAAVDRSRFELVLIGISRDGCWYVVPDRPQAFRTCKVDPGEGRLVAVVPGQKRLMVVDGSCHIDVDVAFPVLHGPYGEDGTVQGLLEIMGVPCVGAGVLGSAVGMDKEIMKKLFLYHNIPTVPFMAVTRSEVSEDGEIVRRRIEEEIGFPCFVKPANLGSSVGVTKVRGKSQLEDALATAGLYDRKIMIEQAMIGRELECSVLGNERPMVSIVGEIVPGREFYDYNAKYVDDSSKLLIPAPIDETVAARARGLALEAFQATQCRGMARVDFFLVDNRVVVNEINTIPGFTTISMYPKLWVASGMSWQELVQRLIDLAEQEHEDKLRNSYYYQP